MTSMLWQRTDELVKNVIRRFGRAPPVTMERDAIANRVMAVYRNDYGGLVDEALQAMFHQENYSWLRMHIHCSTNLLRRLCDETCIVYQEPATRYLKDGDEGGVRSSLTGRVGELLDLSDEELVALEPEEALAPEAAPIPEPAEGAPESSVPEAVEVPRPDEEEEDSPLERLLRAVDLDAVMAECHRLARVLPAVWIFPVVRTDPTPEQPNRVRLTFDIHTPVTSGVDLDPMDQTQAIAFWTWRNEPEPKGTGKRRVRYRWGRDGSFTKWDSQGRKIPNDLAPDETHPWGRLPVTVVRLGMPLDSYYLDGQGADLYEATIEVALLRTLQNARYRDSSFKQLVIDGDPKNIPADQVLGNPAIPIYVNEGTAQVLDLQANLQALSDVVRERVEDIVVAYGVSPSQWSMTEKAQSGFSKRMDMAKVSKLNRGERKWLAEAERDLYRLIAVTLRHFPVPEIGVLDPEAEYVVDFTEPVYEEDPVTQAKADSLAVKLNRTNYLELIMRDNPDLTEAEAMRALALNRLINQRFAGSGTQESKLMDLLAGGKPPQGEQAQDGEGGAGPPEPPPPAPVEE